MAHTHPVVDSDSRFVINSTTREISTTSDDPPTIHFYKKSIQITPSGVGSTDILFQVRTNGTKSKSFDVLGNGEAVAPAIILYSSTANSTKKFRITVDDSGTLKATKVK